MAVEVFRGEPLQVEAGERVRNHRTGEVATVVAVGAEFVRVRYDDGREEGASRWAIHFSRLGTALRPPPGVRVPLRRAGAYHMRERIVLPAQAELENGPVLIVEPYLALPPDAPPAEVGAAVLEVLSAYRTGVPEPSKAERDGERRALLKAAGVRSYRRLQETALACWIAEQSDAFEFTALHNGGTRGNAKGFQPQRPMQWVVVDAPARAAELGEALTRTFELCTTSGPDSHTHVRPT
mgnify:CR=1 FL=1